MARTVAAAPEAEEVRLPMTYEEWLVWSGESTQSEWVDGEAIVFMPTTILHGRVVGFLYVLLKLYIELRDLGEVLVAPIEMRLVPGRVSREPDILFVARAHLDRVTDKRVDGAADLVVEVISPDSVRRDRVVKLAEYAAAGIPEYWLLDPRPRRHQFDFYQLAGDGTYRLVPPDADGRYHSPVLPGFWLRPDWLRQDPLPPIRVCLAEIAPDFFAPAP